MRYILSIIVLMIVIVILASLGWEDYERSIGVGLCPDHVNKVMVDC